MLTDNSGILSRAEARSAGIGDATLTALTNSGELTRLFRGWYAVSPPVPAWERHLVLARATLRHFDGRVALSHYSAARWYSLPTINANPGLVHVVRLDDRVTGHRPTAVLHDWESVRRGAVATTGAQQRRQGPHPWDATPTGGVARRGGGPMRSAGRSVGRAHRGGRRSPRRADDSRRDRVGSAVSTGH